MIVIIVLNILCEAFVYVFCIVNMYIVYVHICLCLFVCLFVGIKPQNPYFASRLGLEVKPLEVYPLG